MVASFPERLKSLRKSKSLTQDALAEAIGVSRSTIAGYEAPSKQRQPDFAVIRRLAEFFSVPVDYLLGDSDTTEPKRQSLNETPVDPEEEEYEPYTVAALRAFGEEDYAHLPEEAQEMLKETIRFFYRTYVKPKREQMRREAEQKKRQS